MEPRCFGPADILLPDFSVTDGARWSCVACDQYTSEPEYWERAASFVGDAPSALRLILPEAYLSEAGARLAGIREAMEVYLREGILVPRPDCLILTERELSDGRVRRGLVGAADLEAYDPRPGARTPIRATEETVPERLPVRAALRRGAPLELSHVLLLMDDRADSVIGPLLGRTASMERAYDYGLMAGAGRLRGFFLGPEDREAALAALDALAPDGAGSDAPPLLAVGDGNHSLAAAKLCYEELRARVGDAEARRSPARFALAEVVNLYDEALDFEPIYRVAFGTDPEALLSSFRAYAARLRGPFAPQVVEWQAAFGSGSVTVPRPESPLCVGTVQAFLDGHEGLSVDYIHGRETAVGLGRRPGALAFLFDVIGKEALFPSVAAGGPLPRKAFSMGRAEDKRFYAEARALRR